MQSSISKREKKWDYLNDSLQKRRWIIHGVCLETKKELLKENGSREIAPRKVATYSNPTPNPSPNPEGEFVWGLIFRGSFWQVTISRSQRKTKKLVWNSTLEYESYDLQNRALLVLSRFECALLKKWSFPLKISSVDVIKSAGNCGFG